MKLFNSHTAALKNLRYLPKFPKTPKVVIFGAPNVGVSTFAHRLAIDIGVPAVSMRDIYRNILTFEDHYRTETFYRKVIELLKNYHQKDEKEIIKINEEMESNMINEKLLILTKYTEMGFVLYDYPNTIKQCENLESLNGGINIFINLLLNKELAMKREKGLSQCDSCNREYNSESLIYKDTNVFWTGNYPKDGICVDCGSGGITFKGNDSKFEEKWTKYENQAKTILPFYQKIGLLQNFEVRNGLLDYEVLRQKVQYNIKH